MRLVVAAVALVACSPLAALAAPSPANTEALSFVGCYSQFAGYPVPMATVQAMLPPGFVAQRFTNDPTSTTGTISLYVQRCERVESAGVVVAEPFGEAWLVVRAIPPEPWRDPAAATAFWVADALADDGDVAARYAAWNLTTGAEGTVSFDRTPSLAALFAIRASVAGPSLAFEMENANAQGLTNWPPVHIQFFGRGPDGVIGAVDHHDAQGLQGGVQPSVARFERGFDELGPLYGGVGRDFRWPARTLSWTVTPVDLPPL